MQGEVLPYITLCLNAISPDINNLTNHQKAVISDRPKQIDDTERLERDPRDKI